MGRRGRRAPRRLSSLERAGLGASVVAFAGGLSLVAYAAIVGTEGYDHLFGSGRYRVVDKIVFVITDARVDDRMRVLAIVAIVGVAAGLVGMSLLGRARERRRFAQLAAPKAEIDR